MTQRIEKLTYAHIQSLITNVDYIHEGIATICLLTVGDSKIEGVSYVFNVADYNQELGDKAAYDKAINKLFELEAYHQKRLGV